MPPVGATSAQATSGETFGSISRARSPDTIRTPLTPFASARRTSSSSFKRPSSSKASTIDPLRRNCTPSSSHQRGYAFEPSTLKRALSVPGTGSKPACTIAEFARVAPQAMSFPASSTQMDRSYRASSRAAVHPAMPAPTTTTSKEQAFPSCICEPILSSSFLDHVAPHRGILCD